MLCLPFQHECHSLSSTASLFPIQWSRFESLFKPHKNPQDFTSNQALIAKQQIKTSIWISKFSNQEQLKIEGLRSGLMRRAFNLVRSLRLSPTSKQQKNWQPGIEMYIIRRNSCSTSFSSKIHSHDDVFTISNTLRVRMNCLMMLFVLWKLPSCSIYS